MRERDADRVRDEDERVEERRSLPLLDAYVRGPVQPGGQRDTLLGEVPLKASRSNLPGNTMASGQHVSG